MTESLNISEDLETMLNFYHDLGKIIHFGSLTKQKRDLMVILDPQWLVDAFKKVITLSKPENIVSIPMYQIR